MHCGFEHQMWNVNVKCLFPRRNPCEKIVASHVPYELPWKSGFSPPCPKSSSLLSLFPRPPPSHHLLSLSFMDMDGRRRDQRGRGPGNGVGQCHPQSIIDANNYHFRRGRLPLDRPCCHCRMFRSPVKHRAWFWPVNCFSYMLSPKKANYWIGFVNADRSMNTVYATHIVCSRSSLSRSISASASIEGGRAEAGESGSGWGMAEWMAPSVKNT